MIWIHYISKTVKLPWGHTTRLWLVSVITKITMGVEVSDEVQIGPPCAKMLRQPVRRGDIHRSPAPNSWEPSLWGGLLYLFYFTMQHHRLGVALPGGSCVVSPRPLSIFITHFLQRLNLTFGTMLVRIQPTIYVRISSTYFVGNRMTYWHVWFRFFPLPCGTFLSLYCTD